MASKHLINVVGQLVDLSETIFLSLNSSFGEEVCLGIAISSDLVIFQAFLNLF
jgi:hypothetical protein